MILAEDNAQSIKTQQRAKDNKDIGNNIFIYQHNKGQTLYFNIFVIRQFLCNVKQITFPMTLYKHNYKNHNN